MLQKNKGLLGWVQNGKDKWWGGQTGGWEGVKDPKEPNFLKISPLSPLSGSFKTAATIFGKFEKKG